MKPSKDITPDPDQKNDHRAELAEQALLTFAEQTGQDPDTDGWQEILGDFLANARHFADRHRLDYDVCDYSGREHYKAETEEEE